MRETAASFVPLEKILDAPVILVTRVLHVLILRGSFRSRLWDFEGLTNHEAQR